MSLRSWSPRSRPPWSPIADRRAGDVDLDLDALPDVADLVVTELQSVASFRATASRRATVAQSRCRGAATA